MSELQNSLRVSDEDWKNEWKNAVVATLPVMAGYVPLGIVFGILFSQLGYPAYFAFLSGLFVFAGAAQFLSVGLLSAGIGLSEIFTTILFLNLRHMFFGFGFLKRFSDHPLLRGYCIFGLTDESYSILSSDQKKDPKKDAAHCARVIFLDHVYWVVGCTIGGLLGSQVKFETQGLEFCLTALFVVLTIEQARAVRRGMPFVVGGVCAAFTLLLDVNQFLLVSLFGCLALITLSYVREGGTVRD